MIYRGIEIIETMKTYEVDDKEFTKLKDVYKYIDDKIDGVDTSIPEKPKAKKSVVFGLVCAFIAVFGLFMWALITFGWWAIIFIIIAPWMMAKREFTWSVWF